jgi:hypothetical protein
MEQSTSISRLAQALCQFQQKCTSIELDSSVKVRTQGGQEYSFKYASYGKILATVKPILAESKLSFSQLTEPDGAVTTILMHESGEYLKSCLLIPCVNKKAQEIGSAISYARRYAISSILGISTQEDDDGNIANGNSMEKTTADPGVAYNPDDKRAWLNVKQLDAAVKRILAGELDVHAKTLEAYKVRKSYKLELDKALKLVQDKGIKTA